MLEWEPIEVHAGETLWFHSRTTPSQRPKSVLGPPAGVVPHLQRPDRGRSSQRLLPPEARGARSGRRRSGRVPVSLIRATSRPAARSRRLSALEGARKIRDGIRARIRGHATSAGSDGEPAVSSSERQPGQAKHCDRNRQGRCTRRPRWRVPRCSASGMSRSVKRSSHRPPASSGVSFPSPEPRAPHCCKACRCRGIDVIHHRFGQMVKRVPHDRQACSWRTWASGTRSPVRRPRRRWSASEYASATRPCAFRCASRAPSGA